MCGRLTVNTGRCMSINQSKYVCGKSTVNTGMCMCVVG